MDKSEKKQKDWEADVRKITTQLIDPGTPAAKTKGGRDKDVPVTDEEKQGEV